MHEDEETIETLAEAMRGLFDMVGQHAHIIASLVRALDDAGVPIPGIRTPMPPPH